VNSVEHLRAKVLQQTGIAIDPSDPLVAVLVASAEQAEQVGNRLLRRVSVTRVVLASAATSLLLAGVAAWATWQIAESQARAERAEWLRQQADPRTAALLRSEQGQAALRLAELGVAELLANCAGRSSWKVTAGYCVPQIADGRPDGFNITPRSHVHR
jgi:hypothetical protein